MKPGLPSSGRLRGGLGAAHLLRLLLPVFDCGQGLHIARAGQVPLRGDTRVQRARWGNFFL